MNKATWIIATLFCTGILLSSPLRAATYYVAAEDPKASDENNGSEATPWKTINRSVKAVKAGDTVLIKSGTYRENVRLDAGQGAPSGKSFQEMITFAAYPGQTPAIKGSKVLTGWTQHKDAVWYTQSAPEKPEVLPILFCDDKHMEILSDWGGEFSRIIKAISGSVEVWKAKQDGKLEDLKAGWYFYDKDAKRLYAWLPDGSDPNKHLMELTMPAGNSLGTSYVKFSGLKILQSSLGIGGSHNIVENCESSDATFGGCGVYGEFNTVIGSKFNRCGDSGMGGSGRGHHIINCETSYNNFLKIDAGWHSGGCKFIPFCSDIIMSGHRASHNIACPGIWFDWGNFNITIENCVCDHNDGAIMIEVSSRATIRNNVCYENYGRGVYLSNSSDCQVFNNVFWHNGMSGVAAIGGDRSGGEFGEGEKGRLPACNNIVWGNVFVDNCHPDFCLKTPDGRDKPWDTRPELIMPEKADVNTGNVSDYNIFFRSPNRVMPFWKGWHLKGQIWDNLADWQAKTGMDKHSIIAEPLFVDAAKYDFHPVKGSPAIDFVKPRMGGVYQFDGTRRLPDPIPEGKILRFTAGPYEYKPQAK
jgi:parallel beta-helix repeat protein